MAPSISAYIVALEMAWGCSMSNNQSPSLSHCGSQSCVALGYAVSGVWGVVLGLALGLFLF